MLILVCNDKGGAGKSTTAVNLVAMFALAGKDTCLVDADAKPRASVWAAVRAAGGITPSITCVAKRGQVGHDVLKLTEKFDVVVADAGGYDSIEMRQLLAVCDYALIPVMPTAFDNWAMDDMAQLIYDVSEKTGAKVNAMAFITNASSNPKQRETAQTREILQGYPDAFRTLDTVITGRVAFSRATSCGMGVVELPRSLADTKASDELKKLYEEAFNEH